MVALLTCMLDDNLPNAIAPIPPLTLYRAEVSMYHSMAYASVLFLQAGFSMDQVSVCTQILYFVDLLYTVYDKIFAG